MGFRTKLDYSDNRQIKQRERTSTTLSGATVFGVPFSGLSNGPDLTTSAVTETHEFVPIFSTYSGNGITTNYFWSQTPICLSLPELLLSALTPSNSAITQSTLAVWSGMSPTVIDDNTIYGLYTGGTIFELNVTNMYEPSPGVYTGTVETFYNCYSASSLDFTGRTIWVDCKGITQTEKLIVKKDTQLNTLNISNLPTSALGLSSGDVWNDSGTLKIIP